MDDRTLLVYATNMEALAEIHGYPLRLYTPNRYGMKNPKWITQITRFPIRISAIGRSGAGTKDAFIKVTSVIDTVAEGIKRKDGVIPVGGIAFGGARGVARLNWRSMTGRGRRRQHLSRQWPR